MTRAGALSSEVVDDDPRMRDLLRTRTAWRRVCMVERLRATLGVMLVVLASLLLPSLIRAASDGKSPSLAAAFGVVFLGAGGLSGIGIFVVALARRSHARKQLRALAQLDRLPAARVVQRG